MITTSFHRLCLFSLAMLAAVSCTSSQSEYSLSSNSDPQNTETQKENKHSESNIFDEPSPGAEAWRRFIRNGRYRVARTDDFNIPASAVQERGSDISRAIEFACTAGDINRDGLSDRACIVVDTSRTDAERFSLVIFNQAANQDDVPEPQWLYKDQDLSRTVMGWASEGLNISQYEPDGKYILCRVKRDKNKKKYLCS